MTSFLHGIEVRLLFFFFLPPVPIESTNVNSIFAMLESPWRFCTSQNFYNSDLFVVTYMKWTKNIKSRFNCWCIITENVNTIRRFFFFLLCCLCPHLCCTLSLTWWQSAASWFDCCNITQISRSRIKSILIIVCLLSLKYCCTNTVPLWSVLKNIFMYGSTHICYLDRRTKTPTHHWTFRYIAVLHVW